MNSIYHEAIQIIRASEEAKAEIIRRAADLDGRAAGFVSPREGKGTGARGKRSFAKIFAASAAAAVILFCAVFIPVFFAGRDAGGMSKGKMVRVLTTVSKDLSKPLKLVSQTSAKGSILAAPVSAESGVTDRFSAFLTNSYIIPEEAYPFTVLPFYVGMARYMLKNSHGFLQGAWYYDELTYEGENNTAYFKLSGAGDTIILAAYDEMQDYFVEAEIHYVSANNYDIVSRETFVSERFGDYEYQFLYGKKTNGSFNEVIDAYLCLSNKDDISGGIGYTNLFAFDSKGKGYNGIIEDNDRPHINPEGISKKRDFAEIVINGCGVSFNSHDAFMQEKASATLNDKISAYFYSYMSSANK